MNKPLFAHRPPSTGVHLLSDPFPEFGARTAEPAKSVSVESSETTKRVKSHAKTKKAGLQS